ncbi:MAG: DedA family protein [Desulfobaccales bacterium]
METLNYLITNYGYWGIFACLATGVFGIPVADEVILMGAGYLVSIGVLQPLTSLMAIILGSFFGTSLNYIVGRTVGGRLLAYWGKSNPCRLRKLGYVVAWFQRVGRWGLPVSYFIPGIRHLLPVVAGLSRLHVGIFALLAASGCCLWSLTLLSLGYVLGEERARLWDYLHSPGLIIPGLCIFVLLLYVVVRWRLRAKGYSPALGCSVKR